MVLCLQASSGSERFQDLCSQAHVALELSTTLLRRGGLALHDEQLHRAASGEHCHITAVSHTTNISLGLGVPPAEVGAPLNTAV